MSKKEPIDSYNVIIEKTAGFPASGHALRYDWESYSCKMDALKDFVRSTDKPDFGDDEEYEKWLSTIEDAIQAIKNGTPEDDIDISILDFRVGGIVFIEKVIVASGYWFEFAHELCEFLVDDIKQAIKEHIEEHGEFSDEDDIEFEEEIEQRESLSAEMQKINQLRNCDIRNEDFFNSLNDVYWEMCCRREATL